MPIAVKTCRRVVLPVSILPQLRFGASRKIKRPFCVSQRRGNGSNPLQADFVCVKCEGCPLLKNVCTFWRRMNQILHKVSSRALAGRQQPVEEPGQRADDKYEYD